MCVGLYGQVCALKPFPSTYSQSLLRARMPFCIKNFYRLRATCWSVLAFVFVRELLLLSSLIASCLLPEQKPHKGLRDSGSEAIQHPLNYGSHRAGNARLMGVSRLSTVARRCPFCSNPPPWINIQQGLSHFARLFVATQWGLH